MSEGKRKLSEGVDIGGKEKEMMMTHPSSSSSVGVPPPAGYETPLPVRETPPPLPPPPKYYAYPQSLARYEDVIANRNVFMDTLEKLHAKMGTKFMIPIIGGKELDLHRLFVEVTSRGGIEKVVGEKRWKEVTAVFNFPSTATNASFVLRKYYVNLIQHYEQIYFFGAKGWSPPSADPLSSPSPVPIPVPPQSSNEPMLPSPEVQAAAKRNKASPSGIPVVGAIDGKFEHGYLVTVMVGTQKLQGVLYHIEHPSAGQFPQFSGNIGDNNITNTTPGVRRRRRRRKSEMKKRDPAHPKPNRSGYNFFFKEQHARLKPLHPGMDREISKMIGELWKNLTEPEKSVYQERGLKDKERYKSEMDVYRARLRAVKEVISDAVPLQQRLAEPEEDESDGKMETEEADLIEDKMEGEEDDFTEEDRAEGMEGDSPPTPEIESILDGSDSEEEKTAEKDAEVEVSVGGGIGTDSGNMTEDFGNEAGVFELRKRAEKVGDEEVQGSSLATVPESTKAESACNVGH